MRRPISPKNTRPYSAIFQQINSHIECAHGDAIVGREILTIAESKWSTERKISPIPSSPFLIGMDPATKGRLHTASPSSMPRQPAVRYYLETTLLLRAPLSRHQIFIYSRSNLGYSKRTNCANNELRFKRWNKEMWEGLVRKNRIDT